MKFTKYLAIFLLISSFFLTACTTDNIAPSDNIVERVLKMLANGFSLDFINDATTFIGFLRALVFFFVFTLVFVAIDTVPLFKNTGANKKGAKVTIAAIIALTTILVPENILVTYLFVYSTIAWVVLLMGPIALVSWYIFKHKPYTVFGKLVSGLILIGMGVVVNMMNNAFKNPQNIIDGVQGLADVSLANAGDVINGLPFILFSAGNWVSTILTIWGIVLIIQSFGGGSSTPGTSPSGSSSSSPSPSSGPTTSGTTSAGASPTTPGGSGSGSSSSSPSTTTGSSIPSGAKKGRTLPEDEPEDNGGGASEQVQKDVQDTAKTSEQITKKVKGLEEKAEEIKEKAKKAKDEKDEEKKEKIVVNLNHIFADADKDIEQINRFNNSVKTLQTRIANLMEERLKVGKVNYDKLDRWIKDTRVQIQQHTTNGDWDESTINLNKKKLGEQEFKLKDMKEAIDYVEKHITIMQRVVFDFQKEFNEMNIIEKTKGRISISLSEGNFEEVIKAAEELKKHTARFGKFVLDNSRQFQKQRAIFNKITTLDFRI